MAGPVPPLSTRPLHELLRLTRFCEYPGCMSTRNLTLAAVTLWVTAAGVWTFILAQLNVSPERVRHGTTRRTQH